MIVTFSGSSDDLVQIWGCPGEDEYNCISDGPINSVFILGGKLKVYVIYDGCWSFAAGLVDEDIPVDWAISVKQNRYAMDLIVDTGDEAVAVVQIET